MPPGDSQLVPDPPPPRPAARDEAIAAAMRRFDGVEEPAPARSERPRPTGGWLRKPQFATAMSLGLIAIIGGPLTWMAVRNGALEPPREPAAPPAASSPVAAPTAVPEAAPLARTNPPEGAAPPDLVAAPSLPEAKTDVAPVVAAPVDQRTNDSAQELAAAPPPPPPPPPPSAPPPAAKKAQGVVSNDIAITGSRIARPNLTSASPVTVVAGRSAERDEADVINSLPATRAATAPDWVLKDSAYSGFLSQLQAAVRSGNRDGVVKLVAIPLRVNSNGKSKVYRDAASVRADYDKIFTRSVRQAILRQTFGRLFGRDQGVMIGNGQVWFDHVGSPPGPVRITAVNP